MKYAENLVYGARITVLGNSSITFGDLARPKGNGSCQKITEGSTKACAL